MKIRTYSDTAEIHLPERRSSESSGVIFVVDGDVTLPVNRY